MPKYSITVTNRQRAMKIDRRRLTRLARLVLQQEQVAAAEISVAILDDAAIHVVNRQFLNHDYPTDVISFLLDCSLDQQDESADRIRRGAGKVIEGEVVISAETAAVNAVKYQIRPQDELALYLLHGLLHLCGYDDLSQKEKRLMRRRESEALARLGIEVARLRVVGKKRKA